MAADIVVMRKKSSSAHKAQEAGFDNLIFAEYYSENMNVNIADAVILQTDSLSDMRRGIDRMYSKGKKVIVFSGNDAVNRTVCESKKVWMLLNPGYGRAERDIDFRNAGLNQVLCTLAAEKKILIGVSVSHLLKLDRKQKALELAKIMQNARLCRKYGARMVIVSLAEKEEELLSSYDLRNLALSFGMDTAQAQRAVLD